ncbi:MULTISPECIES: hypothetical protein [Bacillus]|uniref:hypothetical protein n=1 Tax=Bacillus TaxID=1386 RepID=UPI00031455E7|nr:MULTISPECIES: hypothetical protein [Bacillus]
MKEIQLSEVSIKSAVRLMMEETEYDQFQKIAEAIDIKKTTFQSALDNDAMRIRDLKKVADLLGYTIKLEKK